MKLLSEWGFSAKSWRGERGEYWFLAQALLLLAIPVLPAYRLSGLVFSPLLQYGLWGFATGLGLIASIFVIRGILDLGRNLTPLPHPKEDGQLVQTGIYSIVRHPLYSGLILASFSWAAFQVSLSHLAAALLLFVLLDHKATREEKWLTQKFPGYNTYQQQVSKLFPWLY